MKVSLHIGAHKTATTFLQSALVRNAEALLAEGSGVLPLTELRAEVTKPLRPREDDPKRDFRRARAEACLGAHLARSDIDRLVLSDENLLGEPAEIVARGALYSDAQARLSALAPFLEGHEVTVFFALRNLGDFSRSIYCEALRWMTGEFIPAAQHRATWKEPEHSWVPVVEAIRASFPDANVVLWPHKLLRLHAALPLSAIADVDGMAWQMDKVFKRHSLGEAAVRRLMEVGAQEGTDAMRNLAKSIKQKDSRSPGERPYPMWTPDETKQFMRRFNKDLRNLRAFGPEITVLAPPAKGAIR